jgi:ketosteroid isomerase-like protein
MTAENVGVVLRGADLFNRADVDAMMQLWHPDSRYQDHRPIGWEPMDREQVRELNRSAFSVVADVRRETTVVADPADSVVCVVRFSGHAVEGGGEVELEYAEVTVVRDGLIASRDIYADVDEALASVGLPPPVPDGSQADGSQADRSQADRSQADRSQS